MKHEVLPLPVAVGATGAGTPVMCNRYREKTVQIYGTFVGSLDLEGTVDGTDFSPLIASVTAPGIYTITAAVKFVRTNVTAYVSGQAAAVMGGFDSRSDGG